MTVETQTGASSAEPSPGALPLAGIRVLDLSRVLAGPWAGQSLADLGADVWKVENVDGGDDTRAWSVPSYKGVSTYFLCANRGKKSIAVDLKSREGVRIVRELAAQSDIVLENFRSGTAERLGIGWEALKAINPRLIYCSISGYGQDGPSARRPGYDFVMQAECGLMSITGQPEGEPVRLGVAFIDIACGMIATQSILASLFQRERTGQGQHLDVALIDSAANLLINVGTGYLNGGTVPKRYGNAHPTVVPYQTFETADGAFALAVGNDRQFALLCREVVELPELAGDARFTTARGRALHRDALIPQLAARFRERTRDEWMARCLAAAVPAGMVNTVAEFLGGDTVRERGMVHTMAHPHLGTVSMVRPAHGLAAQRDAAFTAPPMLGQDTVAVLIEALGYDEETISRLLRDGVIATFAEDGDEAGTAKA